MHFVQEWCPTNKFSVNSEVDVVSTCHFKKDCVEINQVGVTKTWLNSFEHLDRERVSTTIWPNTDKANFFHVFLNIFQHAKFKTYGNKGSFLLEKHHYEKEVLTSFNTSLSKPWDTRWLEILLKTHEADGVYYRFGY